MTLDPQLAAVTLATISWLLTHVFVLITLLAMALNEDMPWTTKLWAATGVLAAICGLDAWALNSLR